MDTPSQGWIGGRRFDLFFFFGGSALAAALGLLLLVAPVLVAPLWWAWLFVVDGPHLFATWTRSYLDPRDRVKYGRLLWTSLLTLVPGAAAWLALATTGERWPFTLFLGVATAWAYLHGIRQQYGILAIYQRHDAMPAVYRRVDAWFLQGSLWGMYALFLLANPASREALGLPRELGTVDGSVATGAAIVLVLISAAYVGSIVWRARRGIPIRAPLFVLLPVVATQAFAVFLIGAFEPLYATPLHVEQVFLAAAVVGGIPHGVQYLGIVCAVNRRRYAAGGSGLAVRLGRAPILAYGASMVLAAGYIALNVVREGSPVPPDLAPGALGSAAFLAFYWGLFFHHYWIDQHIWRVSRDGNLRAELGLA